MTESVVSMNDLVFDELNRSFPIEKNLLTLDDICKWLNCEKQTVYNWSKRQNPKKRPPRIVVGKDVRFPRRPFLLWLAQEQGRAV